jgi:hypothetical protein
MLLVARRLASVIYLFRLGKCSPLSPPKFTITESAG